MIVAGQPARRDTIAAIATSTGPAGVGIVRVSGPDAFTIVGRLIARAGASLRAQPGHSLRRAVIREPRTGEEIDDVLLAVFHAPRSFTGEDVVEIQGHGGTVNLTRLFAACLGAGARAALPGEFSERSFTNGKMDLAQAEAVADLVAASTVEAQRAARRQVSGALTRQVQVCGQNLQDALAQIEASIDFPEEVGEIAPEAVDAPLGSAQREIERLLATSGYGRRLREGMTVVLAGRPNVGKSSLLNALSGNDRAIVTDVPGTTRDVVEEALNLGGIPIRALDTAGLRHTTDPVERIGVARAREAVENADVVVAVLDAVGGLTDEDRAFLARLSGRGAFMVAVNKADAADPTRTIAAARDVVGSAVNIVATAARTGAGTTEFADAIVRAATGQQGHSVEIPLVTSARHEDALRRALSAIGSARATLNSGLPAELVAVDAHGALQALGEITGETAREEIIAGIFARFCLGK